MGNFYSGLIKTAYNNNSSFIITTNGNIKIHGKGIIGTTSVLEVNPKHFGDKEDFTDAVEIAVDAYMDCLNRAQREGDKLSIEQSKIYETCRDIIEELNGA